MSKKAKPTIGYWYKMLLHFGLCRGPIDAFLEFRGGDRPAWQGCLTGSSTISIDAATLWGGESAEGGIQGTCEVMFGESSQPPNSYLAATQGADQSAYRGKASVLYHGRYGAVNPYPKPAAFLVRRIKMGWDNDACWYAEKAEIAIPSTQMTVVEPGRYFDSNFASLRAADSITVEANPDDPVIVEVVGGAWSWASSDDYSNAFGGPTWWKAFTVVANGNDPVRYGVTHYAAPMWYTEAEALADKTPIKATLTGANSYRIYLSDNWNFNRSGITLKVSQRQSLLTMNPAHILYDTLTQSDMMGEPVGLINDASFRAAADTLYGEGFGLCTTYDATSESIEDFQKRLCNVIGASLNRSRVNGQWYLDLLRADYVLDDLPVLTDDDILEWSAQPGTLDSAVNQVTVEWFDPVKKETRTTAPCQALGLIQAFGGIKSDASSYPEIPAEALALRCAARELRNKATPVTRFELKTTRTPYAWRPGTCFRLQAPKRGIADMVCRVGEIDTGTIKQGAISLTALQDVFGLPATTYVMPEAGLTGNLVAPAHPLPVPQQAAIEAPYIEWVQVMSRADLDYQAVDAGYLLTMASQPGQAINYVLATAAAGESYQQRGFGDWTPSAKVTAAAGYLETTLAINSAALLDRVEVGGAALWDNEIVRVDAVSATSVTLGRGCADSVPAKHAAGSRLWFYAAGAGTDQREYAGGETVNIKFLSRAGGALLAQSAAPVSTVKLDSRGFRPYPPANATFNGETDPPTLHGQIVLVWTQRNRITQADKLIDATVASLTPEVGTTYVARLLRADNSTVLDSVSGITGTTVTLSAAYSGQVVVELWSERDGYASLQRVRRTVAYTPGEFTRITEDGETRVTESGDARITE